MPDNLTPESAAVRLYAAYHREYGAKSVDVALSRLRSDRNLLLDWQHVAIAADRLCLARIATAEREARVKALREVFARAEEEVAGWRANGFGQAIIGAKSVRDSIRDLITAESQYTPARINDEHTEKRMDAHPQEQILDALVAEAQADGRYDGPAKESGNG